MRRINRAAITGVGTIGLGIAGQLANADVDVLLLNLPAKGGRRNAIGEKALEPLLNEKRPGLLHHDNLEQITIGNIKDDHSRLSEVGWIAEAIAERLEVKKDL